LFIINKFENIMEEEQPYLFENDIDQMGEDTNMG
jgi:hypothetical protein